jgi:hypothetical protein
LQEGSFYHTALEGIVDLKAMLESRDLDPEDRPDVEDNLIELEKEVAEIPWGEKVLIGTVLEADWTRLRMRTEDGRRYVIRAHNFPSDFNSILVDLQRP